MAVGIGVKALAGTGRRTRMGARVADALSKGNIVEVSGGLLQG